jgi:hypothetical protein
MPQVTSFVCCDIFLEAVLRIRDILVRIRTRGSVPLTNGPDPTPDPAIFVIDLQDAHKKTNYFFLSFSSYYIYIIIQR